jgi:tetratricopeptide (TPR) repeat protein
MADTLRVYAFTLLRLGRLDESTEAHKEVLPLLRRMAARDSARYLPALVKELRDYSSILCFTERYEGASPLHSEDVNYCRALAASDSVQNVQLAEALTTFAQTLLSLRRYSEAEDALNEATSIQKEHILGNPARAGTQLIHIFTTLQKRNAALMALEQWSKSSQVFQEAMTFLQDLEDQYGQSLDPVAECIMAIRCTLLCNDPTEFNLNLLKILHRQRTALVALNRLSEAAPIEEEIISLCHQLVLMNSTKYDNQTLFEALQEHIVPLTSLRRDSDALPVIDKARRICEMGVVDDSTDPGRDIFYPRILFSQATSLYRLKRFQEALVSGHEALQRHRRLYEGNQEAYRVNLAASLHIQALTLHYVGRSAEALPLFQEAIDLWSYVIKTDSRSYIECLAIALHNQAIALHTLGRARATAKACLKICDGSYIKDCYHEKDLYQCFVCRRVLATRPRIRLPKLMPFPLRFLLEHLEF